MLEYQTGKIGPKISSFIDFESLVARITVGSRNKEESSLDGEVNFLFAHFFWFLKNVCVREDDFPPSKISMVGSSRKFRIRLKCRSLTILLILSLEGGL